MAWSGEVGWVIMDGHRGCKPLVYSTFLFKIKMSDRRKFFASLSSSNGSGDAGEIAGGSSLSQSGRKEFLASLGGGEPSSRVTAGNKSLIVFDLATILEFKGTSAINASYKQQPEPARLRPNYDNSKRKLFANPEIRQRHFRLWYGKFVLILLSWFD